MVKIIKFSQLLLYIILLINIFTTNNYEQYNFINKILYCPFIEFSKMVVSFSNLIWSFFIILILGLIFIIKPLSKTEEIFSKAVRQLKKIIQISEENVLSEKEQIDKTNKILDVIEFEGLGILALFNLSILLFFSVSFLNFILNGFFYEPSFLNKSSQFLWFDLKKYDQYFIISSIFMSFYLLKSIVFYIKNRKNETNDAKKIKITFIFQLKIVGLLLLTPLILFKATFTIFMIASSLNIPKITKNKRGGTCNEKFFIKN